MHHDHRPLFIVSPLQLPNSTFILWFSLHRNKQIVITFLPPPLPPHAYISIFFQHRHHHHSIYIYIVFPAQPPLKVYKRLHALTIISLLCSHVSGSEGKPWQPLTTGWLSCSAELDSHITESHSTANSCISPKSHKIYLLWGTFPFITGRK